MTDNHFVFDATKCVGCHACMVACSIENKTKAPITWRNIYTLNNYKIPGIQIFHLSLACNHCEDSPCLANCPALAYERDKETGAVIHKAEKCIGCKYCTWACPYDAPKFNHKTGTVEKCNFCNHRLKEGLKPSCVNLCPTGALQFNNEYRQQVDVPVEGFTNKHIAPRINIIPANRRKTGPEIASVDAPKYSYKHFGHLLEPPKHKISLKKEWSLVAFSLIIAALTGILATSLLKKHLIINTYLFLGLGLFAMLLSSMHLGKKTRAIRAILNIKKSWLSREILTVSLFMAASAAYLLFFKDFIILGWVAVGFGFLTLTAIDFVYSVTEDTSPTQLTSYHVFLTGIFVIGILTQNYYIILPVGISKAVLYAYRKWVYKSNGYDPRLTISAIRLDLLISLPIIFAIIDLNYLYPALAISIFLGEIIDRVEFYMDMEVITPKIQLIYTLWQRITQVFYS